MFRVVSAGRAGSACWNKGNMSGYLYATKLYEARPRVRDGQVTWRMVRHIRGNWCSCGPKVEREADADARRLGITTHFGLVHGTPADCPHPYKGWAD